MIPLGELCESPIESALYRQIMAMANDRGEVLFGATEFERRFGGIGNGAWLEDEPIEHEGGLLVLAPQLAVGPYRVDIALGMQFYTRSRLRLAIECDGHEWHDRTKEQARRDRQRDRYLSRMGFIVQRFSGSEIHADVNACAEEIGELIVHALGREEVRWIYSRPLA